MKRALCITLLAAAAPAQQKDLYDESVLRTLKLTIAQPGWFQTMITNKDRQAEINLKADLTVDGRTYYGVGVRARGWASYSLPRRTGSKKLPFRIQMDAFTPDQRLYGYKTLKLNNCFWDPSFLRDVLSCHILRKLTPAPKANFVKLVINNESWGVYGNIQNVDKAFTREWYHTDEGNRYRVLSGDLRYRGPNLSSYTWGYPLKSAPNPGAYHDLIALCKSYSETNQTVRERELPKHLDIDGFLRHVAGIVITGHYDSSLRKDFWLYHDTYHDRFYTVPWDWNLALRGVTDMRFFVSRLLATQRWNLRFMAHLRNLRSLIDWRTVGPIAQRLHDLIDKEVKADPKKFYSYTEFKKNLLSRSSVLLTPGIAQHCANVVSFLDSLPGYRNVAPKLSEPRHVPARPTRKERIGFTVRTDVKNPTSVTLHWRHRGPWQRAAMFDDGKHGDGKAGDGVWGASIPAQHAGARIEYHFTAIGSGAMRILPSIRRGFSVDVAPTHDKALLLELLASNEKGIRDEKGQREDWLELYNPTASAIPLTGMFLTDNLYEPAKWKLPQRTLGPKQTLLVWADDEPSDGPLHAPFGLKSSGEELLLLDTDGKTVLDHVVFGAQLPDVSTGRIEDRVSQWVTYAVPTPRAPNAALTCGSRGYGPLDPRDHRIRLTLGGTPRIGGRSALLLANGPPSSAFLLTLASAPGRVELPGLGVSLMFASPVLGLATTPSNVFGAATVPMHVPDLPGLVGQRACFQALALDRTGWLASNGLEVRFCKK